MEWDSLFPCGDLIAVRFSLDWTCFCAGTVDPSASICVDLRFQPPRPHGETAGGVDAGNDGADRLVELAQENVREDADDEDQGDQGRQDGDLARGEIAEAPVLGIV